jgi:hypothetical protein
MDQSGRKQGGLISSCFDEFSMRIITLSSPVARRCRWQLSKGEVA